MYITIGAELIDLCDQLIAQDGPLSDWYPQWPRILHRVAPLRRHITLAWLDTPTTSTALGSWDGAETALAAAVTGFAPVTVTTRSLETTSHGVILVMEATAQLQDLTGAAEQALRAAYGADAPIHGGGQPHIALAYGIGVAATSALALPVRPVSETAGTVTLVDCDTFATGGLTWREDTARRVALRGAAR